MLKIIKLFFTIIFVTLLTSVQVLAQEGVKASIDSSLLTIGQQAHLTLSFRFPESAKPGWPQWPDTLTHDIEIVKQSKIDTLPTVNGLTGLTQTLTISVFDSGIYFIPPIQVGYMNKTDTTPTLFVSNSIALRVNTVAVDTTKAFRDIKSPISAPLTFREMIPWILGGLALAVIIIFAIWAIRQRLRKESIIPIRSKIDLPPDVEAIQLLEALRLRKLWQNGETKLYYTELTDIMRHYLERRFLIMAAEMTSAEISNAVKLCNISQIAGNQLNGMLQLADLVKFAKMEPLPLENDTALNFAIDFVKETKQDTTVTINRDDQPLKEINKS